MSHVTKIKTQLKNKDILTKVCQKNGRKIKTGAHSINMFGSNIATNLSVQLPGWNYPIAINADGEVSMDNYNGSWGNIKELEKLQQEYSHEALLEEAQNQGLFLESDQTLADGSIEVQLTSY